MSSEVCSRILESKIVVICRKVYGDDLIRLADALVSGGIRCIEVTFDQKDEDCISKTSASIRSLIKEFGSSLDVGAGTVLDARQVDCAADAGAEFIISPNVNPLVIGRTLELGLVSIPGAMTPSEVLYASGLGSQIIKLFPAGTLGLKYFKDLRAPISHVSIMATGGITEENFKDFLSAGACGAGISGRLTDRKLIEGNYFDELTRRAKVFSEIAHGDCR